MNKFLGLSPEFQAALAATTASLLIAYLVVGFSGIRYVIVALSLNILIMYAFALTVRALASRKDSSRRQIEAESRIRQVVELSADAAKHRALQLMEDSSRFQCLRPGTTENSLIDRLGPSLKDFFDRFDSVKRIGGDFSASRAMVHYSSLRPGFISVGVDFASSELVARPGEDRIFIVTDAGHPLDEGIATIYHNVCLLA